MAANASEPIEIGRPGRFRGSGSNILSALQASRRSTLNSQRTSTRSLFVRFEHRTNGGDRCDYSLEAYRSRPAQLGERYETHVFESHSVGFVAPGDPSTAVCMECDMKLTLEGIPERVQRAKRVLANEDVTFARIEKGVHHDGVRLGNGAEVTLQELGPGVKGSL